MTDIIIPGRPRPYDRAVSITRSNGTPGRVHSAAYGKWRRQAARDVAAQRSFPAGTLDVVVRVYADGIVVSAIPGASNRPTGIRGDLDNYVKAALDACQEGGAMANDRYVVGMSSWFASGSIREST